MKTASKFSTTVLPKFPGLESEGIFTDPALGEGGAPEQIAVRRHGARGLLGIDAYDYLHDADLLRRRRTTTVHRLVNSWLSRSLDTAGEFGAAHGKGPRAADSAPGFRLSGPVSGPDGWPTRPYLVPFWIRQQYLFR